MTVSSINQLPLIPQVKKPWIPLLTHPSGGIEWHCELSEASHENSWYDPFFCDAIKDAYKACWLEAMKTPVSDWDFAKSYRSDACTLWRLVSGCKQINLYIEDLPFKLDETKIPNLHPSHIDRIKEIKKVENVTYFDFFEEYLLFTWLWEVRDHQAKDFFEEVAKDSIASSNSLVAECQDLSLRLGRGLPASADKYGKLKSDALWVQFEKTLVKCDRLTIWDADALSHLGMNSKTAAAVARSADQIAVETSIWGVSQISDYRNKQVNFLTTSEEAWDYV